MVPQFIEDSLERLEKQLTLSATKLNKTERILEKRRKQLDRKLSLPEIHINRNLSLMTALEYVYDPLNGVYAKRERVYQKDTLYRRLSESARYLLNSMKEMDLNKMYWENLQSLIDSKIDKERFLSPLVAQ